MKSYFIIATYVVVLAYVLLNLSTVLSGFKYILGIVKPFLMAISIAFIFNIPMMLFENKVLGFMNKSPRGKKLRRPLAIILTILLLIVVVISLITFVIPQLVASVDTFVSAVPSYLNKLEEMMHQYTGSLEIFNDIWKQVLIMWKDILQVFGQVTGAILSQVLDITIGVTSSIINFFVAIVLAIYMLASKEKLILQLKKIIYVLMKKNSGDKLIDVGKIANLKFSKFISGQCTEALIIGVLCFIGMIIFSMPYALLVSMIISVTALIPILGAFIGTIPAVFIIFMVDPISALWFLVLIIVIQQIEGNLIYPKVVGNSIGLSALWVMFAMMVGGSLFGILGMLIGIPLFGVIYSVVGTFINKKLRDDGIKLELNYNQEMNSTEEVEENQ